MQLSLYKPERLPRVAERGAAGLAAAAPEPDEELPKRTMSRSGSSRLLSSFDKLSMAAEKTEKPPKGPTLSAVESIKAAERANSLSTCEPLLSVGQQPQEPLAQ